MMAWIHAGISVAVGAVGTGMAAAFLGAFWGWLTLLGIAAVVVWGFIESRIERSEES